MAATATSQTLATATAVTGATATSQAVATATAASAATATATFAVATPTNTSVPAFPTSTPLPVPPAPAPPIPTATVQVVTACSPRPTVRITTQQVSPGVLGVTIHGGLAPFTRLDIASAGQPLNNVTVDVVGGPSGLTSGTSLTLPGGTSAVQLRITRVDASRSVMLPLNIVDGCGSWATFVGGGPGAF
jgi:hypothetical protein